MAAAYAKRLLLLVPRAQVTNDALSIPRSRSLVKLSERPQQPTMDLVEEGRWTDLR